MKGLDELIGEEYGDADSSLYFELADEDEQLLGQLIEIRRQTTTQGQIAEKMGVTQATVSAFERLGNDPRISTIRRYAKALGVMYRHHLDPQPAHCGDSAFLTHVSSSGVGSVPTAAAKTRGLAAKPFPGEDDVLAEMKTGHLRVETGRPMHFTT